MKTDLFHSCDHCLVFQICWHIECSTFTASYFRIWNSSAGIPSPPLFVHSDAKAQLTLHSRTSGFRWLFMVIWVIKTLYSSSLYSCHLFLISSDSVRSIPFLSFSVPIFAWNVPQYLSYLPGLIVIDMVFKRTKTVFPLMFYKFSLYLITFMIIITRTTPRNLKGYG